MTLPQRIVLLLLALSLFAGVATGGQIYYRLSYFWGLLFFGSWIWSVFSLRGIQVERTARTLRAQVGQIFEERFEVTNQSRLFRLWLEVHNESPLPESGGSQVLTLIGGRQRRIYWSQTLLTQRGVFPLGPTIMASGDIFGLFPVKRAIMPQETLIVYPLMWDIRTFPNPPGLLPGGEALRRRTHQITPNASGIREYYPGDALNRIHWLSTARRNRLMVKEFELDPLAEVWLFLDMARFGQSALPYVHEEFNVLNFWRKPIKVGLPPSTEEYAISIAASLGRHFLSNGRAVGLVSAGQQLTLLSPDRGGRQLGKLLEGLAVLHAEGNLPMQALVESQARHIARGSIIVLITPTVLVEFVYLVEYLLRRGLRPVTVLLDSASFGGPAGTDYLVERIRALDVPVRKVQNGLDISTALSEGIRDKMYPL
jgi:uncharacterized protein (DUF58 family)